jgi:hypothetical protein
MSSTLTVLSWLGRLAWPVLGSLLPGLSPKLMMGVAAVLAALVVIGGPAGAVWLHMRGEVVAERQARDLHWRNELTKANETHAQKLAAARQAAEAVPATPDDRALRLRVCEQSPTCRDRRR